MERNFSLADLIPDAPVINIVHIGASMLPALPEPYAPLVAAGRGARHPVATQRLDDIVEVSDIDYLKIDVQGAELAVFEGAASALRACSLIETEVEFLPLYKDQPLFADIDLHLRNCGFQFHTFQNTCGRYFKPMTPKGNPNVAVNQMIWSDAIYVRDMLDLDRLPSAKLVKLAILLHDIYGSFDLSLAALKTVDIRDKSSLAKTYFARLSAA